MLNELLSPSELFFFFPFEKHKWKCLLSLYSTYEVSQKQVCENLSTPGRKHISSEGDDGLVQFGWNDPLGSSVSLWTWTRPLQFSHCRRSLDLIASFNVCATASQSTSFLPAPLFSGVIIRINHQPHWRRALIITIFFSFFFGVCAC